MSAGLLRLHPFSQRLRERLRELERLTRAELPTGCRLDIRVCVTAPGIDLDLAGVAEEELVLLRVGSQPGDRTLQISRGDPEDGDDIRDAWVVALSAPALIRNLALRRTSEVGMETDHTTGERFVWFRTTQGHWRSAHHWSPNDVEIDRLRATPLMQGQFEQGGWLFRGEAGFPVLTPYSLGLGQDNLTPLE